MELVMNLYKNCIKHLHFKSTYYQSHYMNVSEPPKMTTRQWNLDISIFSGYPLSFSPVDAGFSFSEESEIFTMFEAWKEQSLLLAQPMCEEKKLIVRLSFCLW
ncbi:unnamed protein product [Leptidea sinapis]|uniref:Uncharacterized protein n=1 Tax=Leptidea sinapis TaxID=189913 RepID=A0A5E4R0K3_9NEOP|nr:unnamed protein product [Leptidea sinapis]